MTLKRIQADYRKWLNRAQNREFCLERSFNDLTELLRTGLDEDKMAIAAGRLEMHSYWFAKLGVVSAWDAQSHEVASDLSTFAMESFWSLQILTVLFDLDSSPSKNNRVSQPTPLRIFLLLMALRWWEEALWLGKRILQDSEDKVYGGPKNTPVGAVAMHLYRTLRGECAPNSPNADLPDLGASRDLFVHWDHTDQLPSAIDRACEYHMSRAEEPPGREVHEFNRAPYDVLPVEVMAFGALRERFGLSTPQGKHPLLIFVPLPAEMPRPRDPLIEQLKVRIVQDLPEMSSRMVFS